MSFGGGFGTSTPASNIVFPFATSSASTPIRPTGFGTSGGGFTLGAPAASNTSVFGTPATSVARSTSTLFGTPAGSTASQQLFSTPAASTTATLFGTPAPAATTNTSLFGGQGATTAPSAFGTPASQTTTGFGSGGLNFNLGSTATTSTAGTTGFGNLGGFGASATTSTAPLFGGFGGTNTQLQQQSTLGAGFGGFGAKPAATGTATGFGGFGVGASTLPSYSASVGQSQQFQFQQQQQQQQAQPNSNALSEALYNAVFNCQLFNDERDSTIARWNLIQALWGTGKAFYSTNAPPIELTQENPLCRFKAIGYSRIPEADNNDGLIAFCFAKKEEELRKSKQQVIASLSQILGNKPNLTVTVDSIKTHGEDKSQVIIYVTEKGVTGSSRKIPANELFAYFMQNMQKQQLIQMGVENMFPQVKLDPAQLKEYLDNPPCSIDPRLWKQAQLDNPNPEKYIPVPMIGFQQVRQRLKCQEDETARHRAFLDMSAGSIQDLQRQHTATQAKLKEHRRTLLELQHRVLQVLVRQEITRKPGFSLQPEEELLTNKFEVMHSQISAPTQFKGRISEMLSQLRMRKHADPQSQERYTMDPIAQDDIKLYLNMEQQGMGELIETVNADLDSLKIIKDGMSKLTSNQTSG